MSWYLPGVYKSGNRTPIAAERRSNGALGLALVEHVGDPLAVDALGATHENATLYRSHPTSRAPLTDHAAFELGEAAKKVDEHPPDWGAGVERFGQGLDGSAGTLDPGQELEQVRETAGEPVELPDDDVVTAPEVVEHPHQFGPVLGR
jgi:hypothetical protein